MIYVAIKSCWKNKERRDAVRSTWLLDIDGGDWDYHFWLGYHEWRRPDTNFPYASRISNIYGEPDLKISPIADDFKHIAHKVHLAAKHAYSNPAFTHMVVCDDDTYLRPERVNLLAAEAGAVGADIVACVRDNPRYPQGSLYIVNRQGMYALATDKHMLTSGPDDVIAGNVLSRARLQFGHISTIEPGPLYEESPMTNNRIVSAHKCDALRMHVAHETWRAGLV